MSEPLPEHHLSTLARTTDRELPELIVSLTHGTTVHRSQGGWGELAP